MLQAAAMLGYQLRWGGLFKTVLLICLILRLGINMFIQVTKKVNSYSQLCVINVNNINYMYANRNETVIEFSNESIRVSESIEDILKLI